MAASYMVEGDAAMAPDSAPPCALAPALEALVLALGDQHGSPEARLAGARDDLLDHLVQGLSRPGDEPLGPGWLSRLPPDLRRTIMALLPAPADVATVALWREQTLGLRPGSGKPVRAVGKGKHATGSWATPAATARRLAETVLRPLIEALEEADDKAAGLGAITVFDPACGHGALLAAARSLIADAWQTHASLSRAEALARASRQLVGADIDPWAVRLARLHLGDGARVYEQDSLLDAWQDPGPAGITAILANPPFMSQMHRVTARDARRQAALRDRWQDAARGRVDEALVFALACARALAPGGRLGILLPESTAATRDGLGARKAFEGLVTPTGLWRAGHAGFTAQVRIIAVYGTKGASPWAMKTWHGPEGLPGITIGPPKGDGAWSGWLADAERVPDIRVRDRAVLGSIAHATADFREQYYGLIPWVREQAAGAQEPERALPLVTTGLVDPLACHWGKCPVRYARRTWQAPVVDGVSLSLAGGPLATWLAARLRPKVLVTSQTRTLEAVVDQEGRWVPGVPLISVLPRPDISLWRVATAILAPAATAWALRQSAGSGLSADCVRLPASRLADLPLPGDDAAWQAAARMAGEMASRPQGLTFEAWLALARQLDAAWGLGEEQALAAWWLARRGQGRSGRA
ncbi:MAG: N-6 DNA methylase [Candidatus Sericytochromatia bacterium]|nr:N-6 DNA methylase [Candidatus Sericytochromatia bacterium]